ncbi:MAG: hypothetical protein HYX87_05570 [Chloroflexi bacterium]|nr:hypothetical protein [Chloroflexota bacterium]
MLGAMNKIEVADLFDYCPGKNKSSWPPLAMVLPLVSKCGNADLEQHLSRQASASWQLRECLDTQGGYDSDLLRIETASRQFREWLEWQRV